MDTQRRAWLERIVAACDGALLETRGETNRYLETLLKDIEALRLRLNRELLGAEADR